jgi:hypothetical protein
MHWRAGAGCRCYARPPANSATGQSERHGVETMTAMRIATTRGQDMQPLGLGGQRVIDAAASITAVLTRTLSAAHAALFAEPEADTARGEIDWYAEVHGPVGVLSELPEPQKSTAQAELDRLTAGISQLAAQLTAGAEANERRIGELLMLALNVPSQNCIRVTGTQPVLVGWGHRAAEAGNLSLAVRGMVKTQVEDAPMDILPPPPAYRLAAQTRGMAWPLIAAAVILLIPALYLLEHDLGLLGAARVCRIKPADLATEQAYRQAQLRGTALDSELAELVARVADQRRNCAAPGIVPAPEDGGA